MAVITGRYAPRISNRVESEMPGRNIAEMAIIPVKNNRIASGREKVPRSTAAVGD